MTAKKKKLLFSTILLFSNFIPFQVIAQEVAENETEEYYAILHEALDEKEEKLESEVEEESHLVEIELPQETSEENVDEMVQEEELLFLTPEDLAALDTHIFPLPLIESRVAALSRQAFINQIAPQAQQVARDNDLWPSVLIAQAILESGWGASTLSLPPHHNLFGITQGTGWTGQIVTMATREFRNGQWVIEHRAFRSYPSFQASFADVARVLRTVSFSPGVLFYAGAFRSNTGTFRDATAWLQGRYATDPNYAQLLNNIITQNNLTRFDGANVGQNVNTSETAVNQQMRTIGAGNIRSSSSTTSAIVGRVNGNQTITVTARRTGTSVNGNNVWFRLNTGGWISATLLQTGGGAAGTTQPPARPTPPQTPVPTPTPPRPQPVATVPVYRIYSPIHDIHLFTLNSHERDNVVRVGWGNSEGVAFRAPVNGTQPVFRVFNPRNSRHLFTMSAYERDTLIRRGWHNEGIAFRVNSNGPVPVFRLYNPRTDRHLFTTSAYERDVLVRRGWNNEGLAFRAN